MNANSLNRKLLIAAAIGFSIMGASSVSAQTAAPRPIQVPATAPAAAKPITVATLAADGYAVNANMVNPIDQKQMIVTMQKGNSVYFCQVWINLLGVTANACAKAL